MYKYQIGPKVLDLPHNLIKIHLFLFHVLIEILKLLIIPLYTQRTHQNQNLRIIILGPHTIVCQCFLQDDAVDVFAF